MQHGSTNGTGRSKLRPPSQWESDPLSRQDLGTLDQRNADAFGREDSSSYGRREPDALNLREPDTFGQQEDGPLDATPMLRYGAMGLLVVLALLSFFLLTAHFSSPETYADTIESLDQKKGTVMELVAASTAASGAITLLPGDAGTPIAEKLVDLSSDFLVVLAAIYLEKYLLTTLGYAAFRILIPVGCVLGVLALASRTQRWRKTFAQLALKMALFGIATALLVPASVFVSNMIESTYQESIEQTIAAAQQATETLEAEAAQTPDSDEATEADEANGAAAADDEAQDGGFLSGLLNRGEELASDITQQGENLVSTITGTAQQALADLQETLNHYIEALAMMIVTSCIIPILVLLFFLWIAKTLLGVDIQIPAGTFRPRTFTRR